MATIVNISGTGDANYCYAQVNGTKYTKAASNITLNSSTIVFEIYGNGSDFLGRVTIDGLAVLTSDMGNATYSWTVPSNVTEIDIVLTDKNYYTTIAVTTKKAADPHSTNIGGTAREIESGTVLIGGVLREIESGLVLVNGVAREIEFVKPEMVTLKLSKALTSMERVVVNGQSYTAAGSYEIEKNSTVQVSVKSSSSSYVSVVRLNRTSVVSNRSTSFEVYELVADTAITIQSNGDSYRGYIDISK